MTFPRNLYKKDGPEKLYSKGIEYKYSTVIVENESEFDEALESGYSDDFSVVTSDEEIVTEKEPVKDINFNDEDF